MSEYNRHKWALEWMHGGGRDPNGRSLDEEIRIGKEDWMERQRVARGPAHIPLMAPELTDDLTPMPNMPDLIREEGIQVGQQVKDGGRIGLQSGQLVQPGPGRQGYDGREKPLARQIKQVYAEILEETGRKPYIAEVMERVTLDKSKTLNNKRVNIKEVLKRADLELTPGTTTTSKKVQIQKRAESIKEGSRIERVLPDNKKAELFADIKKYRKGVRIGPDATMNIKEFAKYFPDGTSEVVISRQVNRVANDILKLPDHPVKTPKELLEKRKIKTKILKEGDPTNVFDTIPTVEGKHRHHMRTKGFMIDNEIKAISPSLADLTYLDVVTNSEKLQNVERLRNDIVREQMELFKNKGEGWKIKLKQLNFQSRHLANKMPKDLKGLIYFEQMDELGNFKAIGGDPMKSIGKLSNESKIKFNTLSRGSLERQKILSVVDDLKKTNPKLANNVMNQLNSGFPIDKIMKTPGMKKALPWIKGDIYFAFVDMLNNWTKGQSFWKGLGKGVESATFNIVDFNTDEMAVINHAIKKGVPENEIKAMVDFMNYKKEEKRIKSLDWKVAKYKSIEDDLISPSHMLNPAYGSEFEIIDNLKSQIKQSEKKLKELADTYYEGENRDPTIGLVTLQNMMESLTAEEWNKTAGILGVDRGYREMVGIKADEGIPWGLFGLGMREGFEALGGEETDSLKAFKPQELMSAHPVYGYKEQIRRMEEGGKDIFGVYRPPSSPMEDIRGHFGYAFGDGGRASYFNGGIASLKKK